MKLLGWRPSLVGIELHRRVVRPSVSEFDGAFPAGHGEVTATEAADRGPRSGPHTEGSAEGPVQWNGIGAGTVLSFKLRSANRVAA